MVKSFEGDELRGEMETLPEWTLSNDAIERRFKFKDFVEAVAFVDSLVALAEEWDHHPDVNIHYNEVTLRLWTHSENAITEWDVGLAREIDKLVAREVTRNERAREA